MGLYMSIHCTNCDYEQGFSVGIGMLYSSLEAIMEFGLVDDPTLIKLVQNHETYEEEYWHGIFRCSKCDGLYSRFFVRFVYDNGKSYETQFACSECSGQRLEPVDSDTLERRPCPDCRELTLKCDGLVLFSD